LARGRALTAEIFTTMIFKWATLESAKVIAVRFPSLKGETGPEETSFKDFSRSVFGFVVKS
jgi:hypothetical protein